MPEWRNWTLIGILWTAAAWYGQLKYAPVNNFCIPASFILQQRSHIDFSQNSSRLSLHPDIPLNRRMWKSCLKPLYTTLSNKVRVKFSLDYYRNKTKTWIYIPPAFIRVFHEMIVFGSSVNEGTISNDFSSYYEPLSKMLSIPEAIFHDVKCIQWILFIFQTWSYFPWCCILRPNHYIKYLCL